MAVLLPPGAGLVSSGTCSRVEQPLQPLCSDSAPPCRAGGQEQKALYLKRLRVPCPLIAAIHSSSTALFHYLSRGSGLSSTDPWAQGPLVPDLA